ncbi:AAA family ATPase [Pseudoalteromonas tunicata]|uniref:AAA family ATPase n=1 Tax=Pseudoalteromonas tunicata TaxID=314281 RepID=UPI00273F6C08|nr:AAA family ATPase [Pseudoalteromonas tunicata]MDP4985707.1 AAA family ATPase [Pseudoalteromonas tunicata]
MYNDFYNFKSEPFENTLNAKFFFPSDSHREVLASLMYGIKQAKGVLLLTGEIGAGKTQALKVLKDLLTDDKNNKIIEITNPKLGSDEFFYFIASCLMIENAADMGSNQLVAEIKNKLLTGRSDDFRFVILIDEAQMLNDDALEKVRLLSNLEHLSKKMVQFVLVGQPELLTKLNSGPNRALLQRVATSKALGYLNRALTENYIDYRLKTAGVTRKVFTHAAVDLIYTISSGSPRLINQVCDASLFHGYLKKCDTIDDKIVTLAKADLPFLSSVPPAQTSVEQVNDAVLTEAVQNEPEPLVAIPLPSKKINQPSRITFDKAMLIKLAGVLVVLLLIYLVYLTISLSNQANSNSSSQRNMQQKLPSSSYSQTPLRYDSEEANADMRPSMPVDNSNSRYQIKSPTSVQSNFDRSFEKVAPSNPAAMNDHRLSMPLAAVDKSKISTTNTAAVSESSWDSEHDIYFPFHPNMQGLNAIRVDEDVALSQVIKNQYGAWNATIEDIVRQVNPHINNLNEVNSQHDLQLPILSEIGLLTRTKTGSVYVYYGSFTKQSAAKQSADYLNQLGFKTVFQSEKWDYRYVSRVFIGPYASFDQAQDAIVNLSFKDFEKIFN